MMKVSTRSVFSLGPASITVIVILLVVGLFAADLPSLNIMEMKFYDFRMISRGPLQPSPEVVLAVVDEASLEAEGRWPWPRSRIAKLVDLLGEDGAKVIAFDIGFLEPDENSELKLLGQLGGELRRFGIRNDDLAEFLRRREERADNDLALAKAFRNSPAAIVLGYFYHMNEDDLDYEFRGEKLEEQLQRISGSKYPIVLFEDPSVDPFIEAVAPQGNIPVLTGAADSCGYYSIRSDPDGVVRWMPLVIQCGPDTYPPLSIVSVWHYLGKPQMVVEVGRYGMEGIRIGDLLVPTDEQGQLLINYVGPAKSFAHYSAADVLNEKLPTGTFKDKLVIVGATAMGIHDLRVTPVSPVFPGPEIHATVIDSVLNKRFITKPRWSKFYDLMAIILLASIAGLILPRLGPLPALLMTVGLAVLHIGVARHIFVNNGFWLNIVYPLIALAGTATCVNVYKYAVERQERVKIKRTFRQYLPPLVIEELLKDPERLKMGGEEKELTVLFSDLEGFTGYSERYGPNEMVTILSDYYEQMTEQVFKHRGTLKEYVGDEMLAFFGAPIEHEDHAKRACATALAMRNRRSELHSEWARMGRPQLRARTGINTGKMLVGNLGSRYRFAYGVLGDQVNLGSRLEGLNKMYKTEIIIGENTAKQLDGEFRLRHLDWVRVKGKKKPVQIFELLETAAIGLPSEKGEAYKLYAAAMDAYWQKRWRDAVELFESCRFVLPEDGPSLVMAERCRIYMKTPPPEDWDGVFEHLSK